MYRNLKAFRPSATKTKFDCHLQFTTDADKLSQDLIQSSLTDLRKVESRIRVLSLFSLNDLLDDISTRDLVYLLVPWVHGQVLDRVRTTDPEQRIDVIVSEVVRAFLIFSVARLMNNGTENPGRICGQLGDLLYYSSVLPRTLPAERFSHGRSSEKEGTQDQAI
jgi:hypothetical protein